MDNAKMHQLNRSSIEPLTAFLLARESEIAERGSDLRHNKLDGKDFGNLRPAFRVIFGREPKKGA